MTIAFRWFRVFVIAALLVGLTGLGSPVSRTTSLGVASASAAKIEPAVVQALKEAPDGRTAVFVKLANQADLSEAAAITDWNARGWAVYNALHDTAARTQPAVLNRIARAEAAGRASDVQAFWIVNVIALYADAATVLDLASMPEVSAILPNLKLEEPVVTLDDALTAPDAIEWGINMIGAPSVWTTYGVTGAGAVAANVDTGVQYDHPALVNQYRGNLGGNVFDHNYNWYNPAPNATCPNPNVPCDDNGHGTHTMGTEIGFDGGANQIGVAPGAKWIAAYGCCPDNAALLAAQQWMLAPTDLAGNNPDPSKRPDALNQSWGGPGGSLIFDEVIASLRASGIFPSFSAGNDGAASADGCGRLGSPGDNPSAFNVGATTNTDAIASFSARGPNPFTGKIGPEVSAPGNSVRSSYPTNAYATASGTSMASPHVTGAVTLLISLEPKLRGQVEQLEELLRKTAAPKTSAQACGGVPGSQIPNNVFGWGRIDVKAAADMVWQSGYIEGTVTSGSTPVAGATVTYTRLGKTLTVQTDSNGYYKVVAGAGTWAMTAGAYGYVTASAPTVAVTQNNTTVQNFNLTALAVYTVSGTVTEVSTGTGIPAIVMVANQDMAAPVFAANNGSYSIQVPAGTYDLTAQHPGYQSGTQSVTVSGNTTVNFTLTPIANYACIDSRQAGGPVFSWIDATDGTAYALGDDASTAAITLPAPFNYFGTAYTTIRINSNGYAWFGTGSYTKAHMVLPFEGRPNGDTMAFGEDLNPESGTQGMVYSKTVGSKFVVEYYQIEHWASGNPETFEIIFDTATGEILYQYQVVSWPDFVTVGLEDIAGAVGQTYSYQNSADLQAGRAVRFTPATGVGVNWGCDHSLALTVVDDQDPVNTGDTITYKIHWNSIGFGAMPNGTLTATVPPNTTFVSASGGIVPSGGTLTWNLGNQRPRAEGDAWFKVMANSGPTATTTATVSDTSGQTRQANQTTTIVGQPTAVTISSIDSLSTVSLWAPLASLLLLAGVGVLLGRRARQRSR